MINDKNLNQIGELKAQLNTPKTETRIILNDWQAETKKSKLSAAARNKIVNRNGNYVSERTADLVPVYGPCSTCGVSDKKFFIKMDLRNASGKHRRGEANNTTEAMDEAADILAGEGDWEGDSNSGCFTRANREDLVKKINEQVAEHIKGEGKAVIATVHNIPS